MFKSARPSQEDGRSSLFGCMNFLEAWRPSSSRPCQRLEDLDPDAAGVDPGYAPAAPAAAGTVAAGAGASGTVMSGTSISGIWTSGI